MAENVTARRKEVRWLDAKHAIIPKSGGEKERKRRLETGSLDNGCKQMRCILSSKAANLQPN